MIISFTYSTSPQWICPEEPKLALRMRGEELELRGFTSKVKEIWNKLKNYSE